MFVMRPRVFGIVLGLLRVTSLGDAFAGTPVATTTVTARRADLVRNTVAMSSSGMTTRRELVQSAGAAIAGVVVSALFPAATLAASTEPSREGAYTVCVSL